jgi:DNA-binding response OmpR family regulator
MPPPMVEVETEDRIHVLLVEDDRLLAQATRRFLEEHGVAVTWVDDGEQALDAGLFDLVLLDVNLPGRDGFEVCRELRARDDVPVIMLTGRAGEDDRVAGLESGADDYVVKPFSTRELLARIRAQVRRARGQVGPTLRPRRVGRLTLDPATRRARVDEREVPLTGYEFALLLALAERAGSVVSREQLLESARGNSEEAFDRSIDGHISRLRQKLGDDPRRPELLKTIRGAGYVLTRGS